MRKQPLLLAIVLVLAICLVLCACKVKVDKNPVALGTPTVSVDDNGIASWDAVENASGYKYKIDGGAEQTAETLSVTLTDGQSIQVKAVGDGESYTDGEWSVAKTYTATVVVNPTKLSAPIVSVNESGVASWAQVANASKYAYVIGENNAVETSELQVALTDGQSVKVKAVGDGTNYVDSDWSVVVTYTAPVVNPTKLSAPVVSVNESGVASWVAVENATKYAYVIGENEQVETSELQVALTDGQSVKVKAVGDGTNYADSDWSVVVTYTAPVVNPTQLSAPVVTVDDNGVASWVAVENATKYAYVIGENEQVETSELSVVLTDGQTVKVKAVGDGTNYVDSDWSNEVTYTVTVVVPENKTVSVVFGDKGWTTDRAIENPFDLTGLVSLSYVVGEALSNTGTYYTSDKTLRFYAGSTFQVAAQEGCTIISVTLDIKEGSCSVDGVVVKSGEKVEVNGASVEFAVSSTLKVRSITVEYKVADGVCDHVFGEWTVKTAATCTEDGESVRVCSVCTSEQTKTIQAAGHKWDNGTVETEAGCLTEGSKKFTCSVCSETKTETIKALDHKWNKGEVTKQASCSEEGSKLYTCERCSETKTEAIEKLAHTWDDGVVKVEATAEDDGSKEYTCTVCGETKVEVIPAIGSSETVTFVVADLAAANAWETGEQIPSPIILSDIVTLTYTVDVEDITKVNTGKYYSGKKGNLRFYAGDGAKFVISVNEKQTISSITLELAEGSVTCNGDAVVSGVAFAANNATSVEFVVVVNAFVKSITVEYRDVCKHQFGEWVTVNEVSCEEDGLNTRTCALCGKVLSEVVKSQGHNPVAINDEKAATCEEDGCTAGSKCSICDKVLEESAVLPKLNHNYVETSSTAATCEQDGERVLKCSNCDDVKVEVIKSAGHDWTAWETTKPATCGEDGKQERICNNCTNVEEQPIPATGEHKYEPLEEKGSCTEDSYTYYMCSDCGNYFIDEETRVTATGHVWGDWVVDTPATCVDEGLKARKCEKCNEVEVEIISATGEHTYQDVVTEATCTSQGYTTHTCSVCGDKYIDSYVEVSAHDYQLKDTTPATCLKDGQEVYACSACGAEKTETLPALGHDVEEIAEVPATCTSTGSTKGTTKCTRCEYEVKPEVIEKLPHTWGDEQEKTVGCGTVYEKVCDVCGAISTRAGAQDLHTAVDMENIPATCEQNGREGGVVCSVCGAEITAPTTTPKLGHDFDVVVTEEPTCTEKGSQTKTCKRDGCGKIVVEDIDALGHTFDTELTCHDRVCSVCNTTVAGDSAENMVAIQEAIEPTCTEAGCTAGLKCKVCNTVLEEPAAISSTGHNFVSTNKIPATCLVDGTETFTCQSCGTTYEETLVSTGHNWTEWETSKPATCGEDGKQERICNNCFDVEEKVIPATGEHNYVEEQEEGSCTEDSYTYYICSECADFYIDEDTRVAAQGHVYGEWVEDTPATCVEEGLKTCKCIKCGYEKVDLIPATGVHTYGEWYVISVGNCGRDGAQQHKCVNCDKTEDQKVPATGEHTWGDWTQKTAPTCVDDGEETRACSVCKAEEKRPVAATGEHTYGEWQTVEEATCGKDGSRTHVCSVCGQDDTQIIPATGEHSYESEFACTDKVCSVCGNTVSATTAHVDANENFHCDVCSSLLEPEDPTTLTAEQIVALAYSLTSDGASNNEGTKNSYTLVGVITVVNTAYSTKNKNITVTINVGENNLIQCYRLTDANSGNIVKDLKVGDRISVTGKLKNFKGTIEFDAGCICNEVILTDEDVVAQEIAKLYAPNSVDSDFVLPVSSVENVSVVWSSNNAAIAISGVNATVVCGSDDVVVTLTATVSLNAVSDSKSFTVTVLKKVDESEAIKANFTFNSEVVTISNLTVGDVTKTLTDGSVVVTEGAKVTFSLSVAEGYAVSSVKANGTEIYGKSTYSFTVATSDVNVVITTVLSSEIAGAVNVGYEFAASNTNNPSGYNTVVPFGSGTWYFEMDATYLGNDANKGLQIGKNAEPARNVKLVANVSGLFNKIVINASIASGGCTTLKVLVNGVAMDSESLVAGADYVALTTTATAYTFTCDSVADAKVEIVFTQYKEDSEGNEVTSNYKGMYLKSIAISYVSDVKYTVTANVPDNMVATMTSGVDSVVSGASISENSVVTLTLAINKGYAVDGDIVVKVNGVVTSVVDGAYTFTVTSNTVVDVLATLVEVVSNYNVTLDFVTNFTTYASSWGGYASQTLGFDKIDSNITVLGTVTFNASKQTGTLTDRPVIKATTSGEETVVKLTDKTLTGVKFTLKEWSKSKKFTSIEIACSNDGTNWTTVKTCYSGTAKALSAIEGFDKINNEITFTTDNIANATYVKLVVKGSAAQFGVSSIALIVE